MLETFKARLKAKTTATGVNLSQKRIDAIADRLHKKYPDLTEEADHDSKLDEVNDVTPFAEIAKDDDRIRTLEAKSKATPPQPNDPNNPPAPVPGDDAPEWAKALIKQNQQTQEALQRLQAEKAQGTIREKMKGLEKMKGIPEKFYAGRPIPEKEEELDAFVDQIANDYTEFKQELNNLGFQQQTPPVGSGTTLRTDNVDADIAAWAGKGATK